METIHFVVIQYVNLRRKDFNTKKMKIPKLNVLYQISQSQDPENHSLSLCSNFQGSQFQNSNFRDSNSQKFKV